MEYRHNKWLAAFRVCLLAGLASWVTPSIAQAQLRSGGTPRSIYQKNLGVDAKQRPSSREANANTEPQEAKLVGAAEIEKEGLQFRSPKIATEVQAASYGEANSKRNTKSRVIKASSYQEPADMPEAASLENEVADERVMSDVEETSLASSSGCSSCDAAGHIHHPGHNSFSQSSLFATAGSMEFMPLSESDCHHPSLFGRMLSGLSVRLEGTNWDRSASNMPLLATTTVGTQTSALFGGGNVNDTPEGGGRLTLNTWLDDCRYYGLTFRGWDAGTGDADFLASDATNANIARPILDFTNGLPPTPEEQLIVFPGALSGNIQIAAESEVAGGDLILRRLLWTGPRSRWDMLYGYQFAQLNESLDIQTRSTDIDNTSLLFGTTIEVNDFFRTRNQYHGFSMGIQGARRWGCWYFDGMFKLGLGNMERTITIAGQTRVTDPAGATNVDNEGLLARFSNDGHYISDTFVVVPELGLNVGYALTSHLDLTIGFTAMSLPKVAQAASQLDPQLGTNLSDPLVGELRPSFVLTETNYWLSGFSYGLQYRY